MIFNKLKQFRGDIIKKKNAKNVNDNLNSDNQEKAAPNNDSGYLGPDIGPSTIQGTELDPAKISKQAKRRQDMIVLGVSIALFFVLIIWLRYKSMPIGGSDEEGDKSVIKLEVASNALDSEKMWRNYFEDKLIENKTHSNEKLKLIEDSLNEQSAAYQDQLKTEIEKLKHQIQYLADEQNAATLKLNNIKSEGGLSNVSEHRADRSVEEARINVNAMDQGDLFDTPKSARNFIPETAYVKGVLLGGISVSTAMGSASEPVPVIIKITDRGNLPKNFNIDLKQCRIMGSSYGDLSSERAIIRVETLSCKDIERELIYTTKVAGLVYGDDGYNGIKGRVIQTSSKHLKNAMIGGVLSGFAGAGKGRDQFSISSIGVTSRKKGPAETLQEGAFAGVSNASEKLAEYYIKQAESMSPILLISGGTKVDIVFTKGVYFRALDVESVT